MTEKATQNSKTNSDTLSFNENSFQIEGQNHFVLSGEMHYFRIDADLWPKHLQRMKEAGLNTVSSYIPWSLHEQIEGQPDFKGKYGSNLDLERFVDLCNEMKMDLILKPGPFILAELAMHGIPKWFFENYPEATACDPDGKAYPVKYTCFSHPDYRRKVMQWYDAIMPVIARKQKSQGGPVILMQVCNEVGLFQWLISKGDHSPASLEEYHKYLRSTYGDIKSLNDRYGSEYADWSEIIPPTEKVKSPADHFGYRDWHNFHRSFYKEYISWLMDDIRKREIDVPLFHNVPGWVFGRAKDMPVCLSMYHELAQLYPELILGIDHIPENPSYRNFHDDRIINEFTKALQGGRGPLYVAELQAGTREANVTIYPGEMELFYKACLANGVTAMNYYMFSQGKNPPGFSVYDSMFYLQTPLDIDGEPGDSYPVTQRIGELIKTHGERLCESKTNAKQALVFYPPYYYREFTRPLFTGENLTDPSQIGATLDPRLVTDELLFDGVGKMLAMNNQEYEAVDITQDQTEKLEQYKQLWVGSTEQMDKDSQERLLGYVQDGGHLICFPTMPRMDLDGEPCTVLRDGLGIQTEEILDDFAGMIRWTDNNEEIHAMSYIETFATEDAKVIANANNGKACAIKVKCNEGSATIFGSGFIFQAIAHKQAWQKLGLEDDFCGQVKCDNPMLITRTRLHENGGGYLFILNYHNQALQTNVINNGQNGQVYMPSHSGLMLPFDLPINAECKIGSTTSEISSIEASATEIILSVNGHTETPGQMVLHTEKTVKSVKLDGEAIEFAQSKNQAQVDYRHNSGSQELRVELQ